MISVVVTNLTRQKISTKEINNSAKQIIQKLRRLKKFPFLKNIDLSIVFLEPEKIRELNKKYRKNDKPTDILSFTIERAKDKLIGEILLCPRIIKQKNYSLLTTNYLLKLNHLLIHGLLHLCGYDHKTEKEWKEMEEVAAMTEGVMVPKTVRSPAICAPAERERPPPESEAKVPKTFVRAVWFIVPSVMTGLVSLRLSAWSRLLVPATIWLTLVM